VLSLLSLVLATVAAPAVVTAVAAAVVALIVAAAAASTVATTAAVTSHAALTVASTTYDFECHAQSELFNVLLSKAIRAETITQKLSDHACENTAVICVGLLWRITLKSCPFFAIVRFSSPMLHFSCYKLSHFCRKIFIACSVTMNATY
jgi:hypothetical protein